MEKKLVPIPGEQLSLVSISSLVAVGSFFAALDRDTSRNGKIFCWCLFAYIIIYAPIRFIFVKFSVNSPICFYDDRMEQVRFRKTYVFYYKDLVKVRKSHYCARYERITLFVFQGTSKRLRILTQSECYEELDKRLADNTLFIKYKNRFEDRYK